MYVLALLYTLIRSTNPGNQGLASVAFLEVLLVQASYSCNTSHEEEINALGSLEHIVSLAHIKLTKALINYTFHLAQIHRARSYPRIQGIPIPLVESP